MSGNYTTEENLAYSNWISARPRNMTWTDKGLFISGRRSIEAELKAGFSGVQEAPIQVLEDTSLENSLLRVLVAAEKAGVTISATKSHEWNSVNVEPPADAEVLLFSPVQKPKYLATTGRMVTHHYHASHWCLLNSPTVLDVKKSLQEKIEALQVLEQSL